MSVFFPQMTIIDFFFFSWLTSLQLFLISLSVNYQTIEPNLEKSMIDDIIFISGIEDH